MHPMYHLLPLLVERGELSPLHQRLLLDPLPDEELYDLDNDPHEMVNLAGNPAYDEVKGNLSHSLKKWIVSSGDRGFEELSEEHVQFFIEYGKTSRKKHALRIERLADEVRESVMRESPSAVGQE